MLNSMRALAKTFVAKLLMIVLVASFAIWGVHGLVSTASDDAIAHVGTARVTADEFQRAFRRQVEMMKRQFGDSFDTAQARMFGLDRQVLGNLIAGAAIDDATRKLGLATPDNVIASETRANKAFFGADGKFSQAQFLNVLRENGYNEKTFFEGMRRDITRSQLIDALTGGIAVPDAIAAPLYRFQAEKRVARYVVVAPDTVKDLPAPADEAVKSYFEAHKSEYRTPEYRRFVYALLDPAELAKTVAVAEDKAREYFEFHKDEFGRPEKRTLEQIVYPTKDAAEAARGAIAKGQSFADAAKAMGLAAQDIQLGGKSAKELGAALSGPVFKLAKGDVSQPIRTDFGWALVRVSDIEPGIETPFSDARPAVEARLARDEATEKIFELGNALEDARQSGSTLEEAAKKVGVAVQTVESVDAGGKTPDGALVAGLDGRKELLAAAFQAEQGVEGDLIPTANGGYVAIRVDGITPPADKPLDAVKDEVRGALLAEARKKALEEKANDLLAQAKGGKSLDAIAGALGRVAQTSDPIQRGASNETFSREAVDALFAAPPGGFATGPVGLGESRILMQVSKIESADDAALQADLPQVRVELSRVIANEIVGEYASAAEQAAKVKVNDAAVKSVMGGDEAGAP